MSITGLRRPAVRVSFPLPAAALTGGLALVRVVDRAPRDAGGARREVMVLEYPMDQTGKPVPRNTRHATRILLPGAGRGLTTSR